jgi:hypothetical protein
MLAKPLIYQQITFWAAKLDLAQEMHIPYWAALSSLGTWGTGEMSCKDTIHLICWYLEGRLSTSVEGEIKRHLETCSDCHLVLDAAINTLDRYFSAERIAGADAATRAA